MRFGFAVLSALFGQQLPERVERLRDDAEIGNHGHEIRIAAPARHDVPMQVARHSRSGDTTQIQPDIESLGAHPLPEQLGIPGESFHQFELHLRRQFGECRQMGERSDEQMPVVIRIAVQDDERLLAAGDDEVGTIIAARRAEAEKALRIGAGKPFDIAPRASGGSLPWM